jgi:pyruvate-formate lyase-activating enzyme
MARVLLPIMISRKINVVAIADANKKGAMECGGRLFPIYSVESAIAEFGADISVVVTIANEEIMPEVIQNLTNAGVHEDRIYDCNVLSWITVSSERSYCYGFNSMLLFHHALRMCCLPGLNAENDVEYFMRGRSLEKSLKSFLAKRIYYIEQSLNGKVPLYCAGCAFLTEIPAARSNKMSRIAFSCSNLCNADCVYCMDKISGGKEKYLFGLDELTKLFTVAFDCLVKNALISEKMEVNFSGGEITINPHKQYLYDICLKYPVYRYSFFSNCFIFDEQVANILAQNENNSLMCDMDAGTPETYIAVKGFNKFDIVKENLRSYARRGKVRLKYIVMPGLNDSDADFNGMIHVLQYIGLDTLLLSTNYSFTAKNDDMLFRPIAFALAKFMLLMDKHGIAYDYSANGTFSSKQKALIFRLYNELKKLNKNGERAKPAVQLTAGGKRGLAIIPKSRELL